ncbi:hypothetical protein C8R44DRAFT_805049 [Mycena epipterygia]|nr:hypothetical protein C8R44DRAFT_805049 [Mycena epipterygia]
MLCAPLSILRPFLGACGASFDMNPADITTLPVWPIFLEEVARDLDEKLKLLKHPNPWRPSTLPFGFPNETFELEQAFDFEFGGYTHPYQYRLYHTAPNAQDTSAIWKVKGKPRILGLPHYQIGYVEFSRLLYEPTEPRRVELTDGRELLTLMSKSVRSGHMIKVAHQIQAVMSGYCPEHVVAMIGFNSMEVLNPNSGGQLVPQRPCVMCAKLLPPVGPDWCLNHPPDPPTWKSNSFSSME